MEETKQNLETQVLPDRAPVQSAVNYFKEYVLSRGYLVWAICFRHVYKHFYQTVWPTQHEGVECSEASQIIAKSMGIMTSTGKNK